MNKWCATMTYQVILLPLLVLLETHLPTTHAIPYSPFKEILRGHTSPYYHELLGNKESESGIPRLKNMTAKFFFLWTRQTPENQTYEVLNPLDKHSITSSSFRARKTYIIVHGFLGWGNEPWILHLKDKLLNLSDCNVISVDWPAGTEWFLFSYYLAVARVPKVGKDCARLISSLVTATGLSLDEVHFIGHSLGAHISGLAAKQFKGKIGRISGLDPAGLEYRQVSGTQRLNASDAEYVDVIHSNSCYKRLNPWGDCYGLNENIGHSDFWPNGGEHQPACVGLDNSKGEIGCSHELAYVYYTESLDYGIDHTYFLSRPCKSWNSYEKGNCSCGSEAQYMGFFVNTGLKGRYYLSTNKRAPYAREDAACSPGISHFHFILTMSAVGLCVMALMGVATTAGVKVYQSRKRTTEEGSGLVNSEETPDGSSRSDDNALSPK